MSKYCLYARKKGNKRWIIFKEFSTKKDAKRWSGYLKDNIQYKIKKVK